MSHSHHQQNKRIEQKKNEDKPELTVKNRTIENRRDVSDAAHLNKTYLCYYSIILCCISVFKTIYTA